MITVKRADKIKIAILLNLLVSEGLEIYNTFKLESPESKANYSEVLQKFEDYCSPRQNHPRCEFAEQENGLIRDRIVLGINKDSGLQERLLRENNLSLEKAIEIVRAAEASREQIRNMKYETATINYVKKKKNLNQPKKSSQYECKKCGRKHKPRECPAFRKICTKCNKKNLFAVKCFHNTKNIHEMNVPENKLDVYIDSVTVNETKGDMNSFTDSIDKNIEMVSETWYKSITLDVNHKCFDVNFKLDTGAEVNILPLYILNMFKVKSKLSETNLFLTTYGNFKLKPNGSLIINCSTNKLKNVPLPFYVVNVKSKPILGLKGCKELKLIERIDAIECSVISKNELIKQYKDVFTGIGEFPSEPYHITLKDNSVLVIHPPRRVPQALQPKLKSTLNNLEKEGIVSKVNKPTDWVQSLVIEEKPNGNLRLCLDFRDLNKVIKREHYQIPCTDGIISRLEGKKIFSVVDLKDGFWHVLLDEVSSEICTFNTPFGRYKFNKLPFGIVSAPEVFQKRNQKLFGDIEGVEIYFDDIIVAGYNEDSHDAIMSKVLEKARSLNIKFNQNKLQYRVSEVKYVGQIISKSGIKPDPDHIRTIVTMPTPK
ncbi:transposon Tf2-6 polyprotein [Nephila pilipes]|uniref:Transposon Tf2-6 polyprotein n=1 Tax=Nephila pilipes TaxID=299642 RepID=A0A8X6NQ95_NEPPI|nr:transposon Tf2-6 polyprotein [Nephila pilipes]